MVMAVRRPGRILVRIGAAVWAICRKRRRESLWRLTARAKELIDGMVLLFLGNGARPLHESCKIISWSGPGSLEVPGDKSVS